MTDEDPNNYCGLEPFTTGPLDPWYKIVCERHDKNFEKLKAGEYEGSGMRVAGEAVLDILKGAAAGAYLLLSAPAYLLGAVVGGLFRWGYLERELKRKKPWLGQNDGDH